MKNCFFILTATCLLCACRKAGNMVEEGGYVALSPEMKGYIPTAWSTAQKAIFKDSLGHVKTLDLSYQDTVQAIDIDGNHYFGQCIHISLSDPKDKTYIISVNATGNTSNTGHYFQFLIAAIYPRYPPPLFPSINILEEKDFRKVRYRQTQTLLGKTFSDVFSNFENIALTRHKYLFYSQESGVVGFVDQNNRLWVLDKIE